MKKAQASTLQTIMLLVIVAFIILSMGEFLGVSSDIAGSGLSGVGAFFFGSWIFWIVAGFILMILWMVYSG